MKLYTKFENFINENILSPADELRKEIIKYFLNTEDKSKLSEKPDYDMLLEPFHYLGYDYQTYIQYIDNNTFKVYEGFSNDCWKGFKKQPQYKGLSKKEIIESFIQNRAINLGTDFGYELKDYEYYIHKTRIYKDYKLILTYKKI
jgi:hypothetical protein